MEAAAPFAGENTEKAISEAQEVLSDERFMLQKGLRSLSDKDAHVGNKSKTRHFFGYKAEFTIKPPQTPKKQREYLLLSFCFCLVRQKRIFCTFPAKSHTAAA